MSVDPKCQMVQILKPDGSLVKKSLEPKLPKKDLHKLYTTMVLTRQLDERTLMLQRQGRIGFSITCTGQEAIVGCGPALEKKDWVFPAYREYAVALMRGFPLKTFLAQMFGNDIDAMKGRQMPNHFSHRETNFVSISSPIGTQISHATGAAMAAQVKGDKKVFITFFGDGGTSSNDFHAGLSFAGVYKAPCIFFCSNNQYAISLPLRKQTAQPIIAEKADAYGIPGVRVDGNDVLAIYKVVKEAADRARKGLGPTLIEAYTFRMGAHSSSDDNKVYCPEKEFKAWAKKDPIERFKKYLIGKKIWSEAEDKKLVVSVKREIYQTVDEVKRGKPPALQTIFEGVYKDMPENLVAQQAALMAEAKLKGEFSDSSEAFPL